MFTLKDKGQQLSIFVWKLETNIILCFHAYTEFTYISRPDQIGEQLQLPTSPVLGIHYLGFLIIAYYTWIIDQNLWYL